MRYRADPTKVKNWGKKLNETDVRQIRLQCREGLPQIQIAETFNVSSTMIQKIRQYRMWSHVRGLDWEGK